MASSCRVGWDETELDGLLLNVCDGVVERAKGGGYALAVTLILGIYQHLQL